MVLKCLIPAGGKGIRLRPYTEEVPKPLVEVGGKPLLDYTLQTLRYLGIKDLIFVNGSKSHMIEAYAEKISPEFNSVCITQKPQEMLGFSSTFLSAEKEIDDDFVMLLPDFIFVEDMSYVLKKFYQLKADSAIVLRKGTPWMHCGSFDLHGDIVRDIIIHDGSPQLMYSHLAYGMDVHKPDFIDSCKRLKSSKRGEYEIISAYKHRLTEGKKFIGVEALQKAHHISSFEDKLAFEQIFCQNL